MNFDALSLTGDVWILLGIIWLLGALRVKATERREPMVSRLLHAAFMVAAFVLLYDRNLNVELLSRRFVPETGAIAWGGFGLVLCGASFALWARFYIGTNWSANVTLKQDHELIRSGPYAVVRHPIYSGLLLAILGTAVVIGEVRTLIGLVLAFAGWRIKAGVEEGFMAARFGEEYTRYRRQVKALIPFVY